MKLYVPANFIGCGVFALATRVGVAVFAEGKIYRPGATYAIPGALWATQAWERLLVTGSEGTPGADCLSELECLVRYTAYQRQGWCADGMRGDYRTVR